MISNNEKEGNHLDQNEKEMKTIQEKMAQEDLVKERVDEKGIKWRKVYFGGGAHFQNWLEQCKEMGEVKK